jgi:hypothetical protein
VPAGLRTWISSFLISGQRNTAPAVAGKGRTVQPRPAGLEVPVRHPRPRPAWCCPPGWTSVARPVKQEASRPSC